MQAVENGMVAGAGKEFDSLHGNEPDDQESTPITWSDCGVKNGALLRLWSKTIDSAEIVKALFFDPTLEIAHCYETDYLVDLMREHDPYGFTELMWRYATDWEPEKWREWLEIVRRLR